MAAPDSDPNLLQWSMGLVAAVLAAWINWLRAKIDSLQQAIASAHDAAIKAAHDGDRDLWSAITKDRDAADAWRTRMLERMADIPTKSELAAMEARLAHRIDRETPHLRMPG